MADGDADRSQAPTDPFGGVTSETPEPGQRRQRPGAEQPTPDDGLQRLWAPWRFGYIADEPEIDGCPFCVLPARGSERDRESLILHRGEHAYVIFNAYPYNPGHVMVIPYDHVADLEELDEETSAELWALARRAVVVLKDRVGCEGINMGANLGPAAGAGIAEHVHLHVVPRWSGDTNFISVVGATRVLPRALDEMYDEVAPGFADGSVHGRAGGARGGEGDQGG